MTDVERDARIAALEARLADLASELERARKPRMVSMRATGRCPACDGRRLLHFRRIKDVTKGGTLDLSLQKDYSVWWGVRLTAGALEAYACRSCKLVEWHAVTLDDVKPDGADVVELVDADESVPPGEPYR
jgi:hypothetical protein